MRVNAAIERWLITNTLCIQIVSIWPRLRSAPTYFDKPMKRDRKDREEQRCEVYLRLHLAHAGKDYPEGMSEAAHILILYLSRWQIILQAESAMQ